MQAQIDKILDSLRPRRPRHGAAASRHKRIRRHFLRRDRARYRNHGARSRSTAIASSRSAASSCSTASRPGGCGIATSTPSATCRKQAFEVHGLSIEFLLDQAALRTSAPTTCSAFIEGAMLVMHNAAFDFAFLNAELERLSRPLLRWDRVVDTLALARRRHPGAPCSLDALCKRYGVDLSERDKHSALLDCRLLARSMWSWSAAIRRGSNLPSMAGRRRCSRPSPRAARMRPIALASAPHRRGAARA